MDTGLSGHGCCQRKNIRKKNRSKTAVYKIPSVVAYTVFYTKTRCMTALLSIIQLSNDVDNYGTGGNTGSSGRTRNTGKARSPRLPGGSKKSTIAKNEIMYDNATYGAEYIELYNPSNSTVSVPSLKLLRYIDNGSGTTQTTTTAILKHPDKNQRLDFPPHGYICLTKSAATLINKHKADKNNIIQISTFPRINNDGGYLAITTNEEKPRIIDKCIYSDKMHNEGVRNQGVSLEKKSPELKSALKIELEFLKKTQQEALREEKTNKNKSL